MVWAVIGVILLITALIFWAAAPDNQIDRLF